MKLRNGATCLVATLSIFAIALPTVCMADSSKVAIASASQYPTPGGSPTPDGDTFSQDKESNPLAPYLNFPFSTCSLTNLPTPNLTEPAQTAVTAANHAINKIEPFLSMKPDLDNLEPLSDKLAAQIQADIQQKTQLTKAEFAASDARTLTTQFFPNIPDAATAAHDAVLEVLASPLNTPQGGGANGDGSGVFIAQTGNTVLNYAGVQTFLLRMRACEVAIDRRYTDVYISRRGHDSQVDYDLQAAHAFCQVPDLDANDPSEIVFPSKPISSNAIARLDTPPQTSPSNKSADWNNYRLAVLNHYSELYELLSFCQSVSTAAFPANSKRFFCAAGSPSAAFTTLGVALVATGGLSITLKAVAVAIASLSSGCGGGGGNGNGSGNASSSGGAASGSSGTPKVNTPGATQGASH